MGECYLHSKALTHEFMLSIFRYNAAIPFIIAMVVTLIGMVLDGYVFIKNMPESKRYVFTTTLLLTIH